jgi:hypothetical protein
LVLGEGAGRSAKNDHNGKSKPGFVEHGQSFLIYRRGIAKDSTGGLPHPDVKMIRRTPSCAIDFSSAVAGATAALRL